jgi:predicted DNA-binding transcriptional regulator AlpA
MGVEPIQPTSPAVSYPGRPVQPPVALGLSRAEASAFVGVGVSLFDEMVKDGRMPPPRKANSRLIWSRVELEKAFTDLPYAWVQGQSVESSVEWDFA